MLRHSIRSLSRQCPLACPFLAPTSTFRPFLYNGPVNKHQFFSSNSKFTPRESLRTEKDVMSSQTNESLPSESEKQQSTVTEEHKRPIKKTDFKFALELLKPEKRNLSIAIGALAVSSSVSLAFPTAVGKLLDVISSTNASIPAGEAIVSQYGLYLLSAFIVGTGATFLRSSLLTISADRITAALRKRVFERLTQQPISFFDLNRTGELSSRLSADIQVVSKSVTESVTQGLRGVVSLVGGSAFLFSISPKLTIVSLLVMPIVGAGAVLYGKYVKRYAKVVQANLAAANSVAEERMSNIRTVRLFNAELLEAKRYGDRITAVFLQQRKQAFLSASFNSFLFLSGYMSLLTILWCGGNMVVSGELTVGALSSFSLYSVTVGLGSTGLSDVYGDLQRAFGANERIREILNLPSSLPTSPSTTTFSSSSLSASSAPVRVELRDIRFSYPSRPEAEVLQGLTLTLNPGETLALTGPSGSSKSTTAALITGLYRPASGQILWDGQEVTGNDELMHKVRDMTSIVPQEPVLFSGTIFDNIAYGLPNSDLMNPEELQALVEDAAKTAGAHDFISSFPQGYNTLVGERGSSLSGGQKQRVALSRAIIRNPRLLILDEASSALDAESERKVQEALGKVLKGRTCLVIAHRLSSLQHADRIAVLDNGVVVEQGTYQELMMIENGLFRRLVEQQLKTQGSAAPTATIVDAEKSVIA